MNQSHQDAYRGGLAGAVRPDESHDLSLGDLQVNVVEREVAIPLPHAVEFYRKIRHFCFLSRDVAAGFAKTTFEFFGLDAEESRQPDGLLQMLLQFLFVEPQSQTGSRRHAANPSPAA